MTRSLKYSHFHPSACGIPPGKSTRIISWEATGNAINSINSFME
jgi:hypothetical protein